MSCSYVFHVNTLLQHLEQRKQALSASKQHRIRAFLSSQENLAVFFSTQTNLGLILGPNNSKLSRSKNKENNFQFATRRAAANSRFYRSSCTRKYHFDNDRKTPPSSETNNWEIHNKKQSRSIPKGRKKNSCRAGFRSSHKTHPIYTSRSRRNTSGKPRTETQNGDPIVPEEEKCSIDIPVNLAVHRKTEVGKAGGKRREKPSSSSSSSSSCLCRITHGCSPLLQRNTQLSPKSLSPSPRRILLNTRKNGNPRDPPSTFLSRFCSCYKSLAGKKRRKIGERKNKFVFNKKNTENTAT